MKDGIERKMVWHKLTKKTMPPEEVDLLLWLDVGYKGFPVTGINTGTVIMYASYCNGLTELDHSEWRRSMWAVIESPEE